MAVPAESILFDLACATRPVFERVLGVGLDSTGLKASEAGLRPLAVAAQQLQAAHVGAQIESLVCEPELAAPLRLLATDYGSAAQASLNLAVRCSVTSVDLCVAAIGRLCMSWPRPNGREADTGELRARPDKFLSPHPIVAGAVQVLAIAVASPIWTHITDLRDQLTHRIVLHGVTVSTRPGPQGLTFAHGSAEFGGAQVPLNKLTIQIVDRAESIFRAVCNAIS